MIEPLPISPEAAEKMIKDAERIARWIETTQAKYLKPLALEVAAFEKASQKFNEGMQQAIENMPKPENPEIGDRWYDGKNKMLTEWDGRQWIEVLEGK